MSRVGKNPIIIPSGVTFDFDNHTRTAKVTSNLGNLEMLVNEFVELEITEGLIKVKVQNDTDRYQKAIWGTTRAVLNNLVQGVSKPFEVELELNGVGYRMELAKDLTLYLGFSHPVVVKVPEGIKLNLEKNLLKGSSVDKQLIGNFFANIYSLKPCDVYKQKGFKYPGRFYKKKVGKKGK